MTSDWVFVAIVTLALFRPAYSATLAEALFAGINAEAVQRDFEQSSAKPKLQGETVDCSVLKKPTHCIVKDDLIKPDVVIPAFARSNRDFLQLDRRHWSKANTFMIVSTEPGPTFWMPLESLLNGEEVYRQIVELAKTRAPYQCVSGACEQVLSIERSAGTIFANCSVTTIDNVVGFPSRCQLIAYKNGTQIWLRAVDQFRFRGDNPHTAISDSITVRAAAEKGVTGEKLLLAAEVALKTKPFLFEKRLIRGGYSLLAIAQPRESEILQGGWYESPSVSVTAVQLTLYIDCDLRVTKYNTSRPEDWHDPEPAQQSEYCGRLVAAIASAVSKACGNYGAIELRGTNRLECK